MGQPMTLSEQVCQTTIYLQQETEVQAQATAKILAAAAQVATQHDN
jgi:hypothetical protein